MLDELVVEDHGVRYLGHLWAGTAPQPLIGPVLLRWCFSRRGEVVAEFPATQRDTPEDVRRRFLAVLHRIEPPVCHTADPLADNSPPP